MGTTTNVDRAAAHDAALNLFFPTDGERAAHETRVQALLARNAALLAVEEAREEVAISKKDLAAKADLDASALRKLLTTEGTNPTTDTLFRLCAALGIHLQAVTPAGKTFHLT